MNKLTLASIISAILVGPALAAQDNKTDMTQPNPATMNSADFATLDTDQDGFISQGEAQNQENLWAAFASTDADQDGQLSPSEYESYLSSQNSAEVEDEADDDSLTVTDDPVPETEQAQHKTKTLEDDGDDVMDSAKEKGEEANKAATDTLDEATEDTAQDSEDDIDIYSAREPAVVKQSDAATGNPEADAKATADDQLAGAQGNSQTSDKNTQADTAAMAAKEKSASQAEAAADVDSQAALKDAEQMTTQETDQPIPAEDFPYIEDEEIEDTATQETQPTGLEDQDETMDKAEQSATEQMDSDMLGQPGAIAPTERAFSAVDVNKDGYIDMDEARDIDMTADFSEADKDQDDRISETEYKSYTHPEVNSH